MKFPAPLLIGAVLLAAAPALAQTALKIGVFEPQRVTQDTAEGAKVQARLTALKDKKTAELKKMQEEYEKLQQEFLSTSMSLTDEKKREAGLRLQRKQDELESAQKAAQRELQMEMESAYESFERRVIELVSQYGKQNNFTLIVQSTATLYFSPDVDITNDLMKLIDAKPAAAPVAPAPAAPPAETRKP